MLLSAHIPIFTSMYSCASIRATHLCTKFDVQIDFLIIVPLRPHSQPSHYHHSSSFRSLLWTSPVRVLARIREEDAVGQYHFLFDLRRFRCLRRVRILYGLHPGATHVHSLALLLLQGDVSCELFPHRPVNRELRLGDHSRFCLRPARDPPLSVRAANSRILLQTTRAPIQNPTRDRDRPNRLLILGAGLRSRRGPRAFLGVGRVAAVTKGRHSAAVHWCVVLSANDASRTGTNLALFCVKALS